MNLENAERLLAWMRANGVVCARVGDLALTLGEPVPVEVSDTPWAQHLREQGKVHRYAVPEDDPDLYGRRPPGLDE